MNTDIQSRAMLARLSITQWSARKHDKAVSERVRSEYSAASDAGRYNKVLVASEALKAVQSAAGAARLAHYRFTLPWRDDGARILPSAAYLDYTSELRKLEAEYWAAVDQLVSAYPDLVAQARIRLNGMFCEDDYPAPHKIRSHYTWETSVDPLPSADDFRVSLSDDETARIQKEITDRTQAAVSQGMRDAWQRLYDAVSHMADRLSDADAIFRDSLVGNVRDLCSLLPKLNLTGDAHLERMRQDVEARLAGCEPQDLRDNKRHRADVAQKAREIQSAMAAFMGGAS